MFQSCQAGVDQGLVHDPDRADWDGSGPRPLRWTAWYPAETDTSPNPVTAPDALFVDPGAIAAAPMKRLTRGWPVVLLSHGTGGSAGSLGWLAVRLARSGYLVLGVDHHGNTASEPYRAEGFLCWWERARDLTVLIEQLVMKGPFSGLANPAELHGAGFSLGGYTMMSAMGAITDMGLFRDWMRTVPEMKGPREFPDLAGKVGELIEDSRVFRDSWDRQSLDYRDGRIRSALLCAPAPTVRAFREESIAAIAEPVSIIVGGSDTEAPSDTCAEWLQERLPESRLHLLEREAGHYVFLCECTEAGKARESAICVDAPNVKRRAIHDRTASLALDLFSGERNTPP